ncbi:MAG TPA: hypothetical protein QGI59_00500 [Candidatus Poseidoniia archaeon]|nr:hypothetical protein [Candidatus Poseidoniia archaeon]
MQRQLSLGKSEDAVSPVIGTVLILAIMITITGTMLAWGIPQIQQSEAYAIYTSSQNNLLNFDADLDHVILQGEGASRTSTVSFSSGSFVERSNLDEIKYYYTTVSWSDPTIVGVGNGATKFAMMDSKSEVSDYKITITYPNGTEWMGTTSEHIVSGFPELVYGVQATYTSTVNTTQVGGFYIYGTDSLSYMYSSVSGVFKMRMFNGGVVSKEPGGPFFVSSKPLVRSVSDSEGYDSLTFYQTDYNISSSAKSLTAGNFIFDARNQGGRDVSLDVYSVRVGFSGDSSLALRNYYNNQLGFSLRTFYFTPAESLVGSSMGFEEDVIFSQASNFDFRILERTINVKFNLR